jgi:hypothetical protein
VSSGSVPPVTTGQPRSCAQWTTCAAAISPRGSPLCSRIAPTAHACTVFRGSVTVHGKPRRTSTPSSWPRGISAQARASTAEGIADDRGHVEDSAADHEAARRGGRPARCRTKVRTSSGGGPPKSLVTCASARSLADEAARPRQHTQTRCPPHRCGRHRALPQGAPPAGSPTPARYSCPAGQRNRHGHPDRRLELACSDGLEVDGVVGPSTLKTGRAIPDPLL